LVLNAAVAVAIGMGCVPVLAQPVSAAAPVGAAVPESGAAVPECDAVRPVAVAAVPATARLVGTEIRQCVRGEIRNGATAPQTRSSIGTAAVACPERRLWGIERFEACRFRFLGWDIFRDVCDSAGCRRVFTGTLDYFEEIRIFLSGRTWQVGVFLQGQRATGEGLNGMSVRGFFGCQERCRPIQNIFPFQILMPTGTITGSGTLESTVPSGSKIDRSANATVELTWTPISKDGGIPNTQKELLYPNIRCDSIVTTATGCVFPEAGIVYDLVDTSFPEVARHVRLAQASGLAGKDIPLHRTLKENVIADNRAIACPFVGPLPPPRDSCDEYPFASTYEGASKFGEGFGRTFPDCDRFDLPLGQTGAKGWSACNLDLIDNVSQGRDLQQFYIDKRVLDGDDFYVEVT
jgi:hypothetical protein